MPGSESRTDPTDRAEALDAPQATDQAKILALATVIRGRDAHVAVERDARAFARRHGLDETQAEAFAQRGAKRLLAYRQLVHNRVRNVIEDWLPGTVARIGQARLQDDVAAYLDEVAVHSPYLRDVPAEFVAWVASQWSQDAELADYIVDLARYELLRNDVRNDPRGGEVESGHNLELAWGIRINSTARVLDFDHAVHKLPRPDASATALPDPPARPVCLVVFRNRAENMMYKELDAHGAGLVRRLLAGDSMQTAIVETCRARNVPLDDAVLGDTAVLLARLSELGLILGGEPPSQT